VTPAQQDLYDRLTLERAGVPSHAQQLADDQAYARRRDEMDRAYRDMLIDARAQIATLEAEVARLRALRPAPPPPLRLHRGGKTRRGA